MSDLHSIAVLQVFQAKMLKHLDEDGPDPEIFRELRSATGLALRAPRSIGHSIPFVFELNRHLWFTLTDLKDAGKAIHLNAPMSPVGLFVNFVESLGE